MPERIRASSVWASPQGTVSQLVGEYFNRLHGLDITSVPYRGGALVIPDMLGGRITMYWPTPATVLPLLREGKIKALAISSPQRSPDLPQVPTMKELGIEELSLEYWAGIWAPAGTPPTSSEKLNAAVNKALQSPELIASLKKLGFETRIGSPRDFAAFITDGNSALGRGGEGIRREKPVSLAGRPERSTSDRECV